MTENVRIQLVKLGGNCVIRIDTSLENYISLSLQNCRDVKFPFREHVRHHHISDIMRVWYARSVSARNTSESFLKDVFLSSAAR